MNAALLAGLAIGLLYFNEVLFVFLARAAMHHAQPTTATRFLWFSGISGGLLGAGVMLINWRLGLFRTVEIVVNALAALGIGVAFRHFPPLPREVVGVTTLFLAWSARGVIKKRFTRKNTVRI